MVTIIEATDPKLSKLMSLDLTLSGVTNPENLDNDLLFLYNIFRFASPLEIKNYFHAPAEWLVEIYPEAQLYGPHFREVNKVLTKVQRLGLRNKKVVDLRAEANREWRRDLFEVKRALRKVNRKAPVLTDVRKKFGETFSVGLNRTLHGLIARDLIQHVQLPDAPYIFSQDDYNDLTVDWRLIFGEITTLDDPNFVKYSKFARYSGIQPFDVNKKY